MVRINFLGPINLSSIEIEAKTLQDVANELKKIEKLNDWLEKSAIAVNDSISDNILQELKDGDIISILPPVCGG